MEQQLKTINLKQDRNLFFMLIMVGTLLNFMAVSINDSRMPVKTDIEFNDGFHFSYQESSEVKLWLLTDIFNIKNIVVFSLGDVIAIFGLVGFITKNFMIMKNEK